jgi:glycosyltransferase involved in cell wall biosynthesis
MRSGSLVSVYIPTRNRVGLLEKAVESVLAQTYGNIELLVVDDASTDGTQAYLRDKAKSDPRLRPFQNSEPRGAPASRNLAILKATGSFVTGLDDDDEFLPERLSAFVDYWDLLASCNVRPACLYAQDIWLMHGARRPPTRKQSSVTAENLFEYNYIGNQVFAPRAHFVEAGLFDEQLPAWQDLEFFMRLLRRFGRAHLLDMPTYLFDATPRPDRISSQENKIRKAFALVAQKHCGGSVRQEALFLQMFQDGYNISPGMADWLRYMRSGRLPKGLRRMLRATLGRRQGAVPREAGKPELAVSSG